MTGIIGRLLRLIRGESKDERAERLLSEGRLVAERTEEEREAEDIERLRDTFEVRERDWMAPIRAQSRVRQAREAQRRPLSSYTGPGMRKLKRSGRGARLHQRRMGMDPNLRMKDIEDEPRRRRRR